MTKRSPFGSQLYSQIVLPLLAASVIVGLVAMIVAVFFLRDLTDKWVAQVAASSTENLAYRYEQYSEQLQRSAAFAANDPDLRSAIERGDEAAMRAVIVAANTSLGLDGMMLLDSEGRAVASSGLGVTYGSRPLASDTETGSPRPHQLLARIGAVDTITAVEPVGPTSKGYRLAIATAIDDEFLKDLGIAPDAAYCFYSPEGRRIACAAGSGLSREASRALLDAMRSPGPEMRSALNEIPAKGFGRAGLSVGSDNYQLWALPVALPDNTGKDARGYLVGVVSQNVSDQAGQTTINLIAMWSLVAIVALVGLGGWVARRVSDPLVELAAGARRVADGDFSTRVEVSGNNEVAQLAETFNEMTESLNERSESLTKKVLELATLYEMSRSLGSTLDMDELLASVLDSALRIFDLDLGYIVLRDKEAGTLEIRAMRGVNGRDSSGAVRSSMSEWVVREGRPLIFNPEPTADARTDGVTGAKAALCVPLISSEGTIGSITIGSSDTAYRFNSDDVRLLSTIANHVTIAIGNIELFTSLQEAYLATVRSLAAAVDAKDTYTRGHSDHVALYATLIGERLGLAHEQRVALEMAAYLHDIGKIGINEDILLKPGKLDDAEMEQMRHHPLIGANILKPVAFPWAITPVVRHHHEHYDGTGYPAGLRGEEIPLLARVLTVADSYEAMTADRPYRKGRSAAAALAELARCSGTQFDPRIVEVFTEVVTELEKAGVSALGEPAEDISSEEARAIFAALVDGLFASFRRLGGPRLASNVEREVDEALEAQGAPFRLERGHVVFTAEPSPVLDEDAAVMRDALRRIDATMGRVSGNTLVEHFYADALEGLSGRMRYLARVLGFYDAA